MTTYLCNKELLFSHFLFVLVEKVNFIDFEYTAYNYQAFDISIHFCDYPGDDCRAVMFSQCHLFVTLNRENELI